VVNCDVVTSFDSTLDATFPGALPADRYLAGLKARMEPMGFTPDRTLALVSICRDEMTTRFFGQVEDDWGNAFTLAGLGGVPALGWTGWEAALAHIPDTEGRGHLLVIGMPHIGIEADGSIGFTIRPGQDRPTSTCCALSAIVALAAEGKVPTEVDVDDYEATQLAMRLVDRSQPAPALVELTIAALDAIEVDVWRALDRFEVWRDHDVSLWCGVQIHGHDGDWVWPRDAWYCGADGHRRRVAEVAPSA
jgi:hypothetical protein